MMAVQDQIGRNVYLNNSPKRIISLVPSQTEVFYYLGVGEKVVGATHFCIHPKKDLAGVEKIGGTKGVKLEKIASLKPDLIVGNKEENDREDIEWLTQRFPTYVSDVNDELSARNMIEDLGLLTGQQEKAALLSGQIEAAFANLPHFNGISALYLIWYNPWMCAAQDTYINRMMDRLGIMNVSEESRYPEMDLEQIKELKPELIMLSSEPFPFKEKHKQELKSVLPNSEILLIDGEMFSWYGPRMLKAAQYFKEFHRSFHYA